MAGKSIAARLIIIKQPMKSLRKAHTGLTTCLILVNIFLLSVVTWLVFQKNQKSHELFHGIPAIVAKVNGYPLYARDLLSAAQLTSRMPSEENLRKALEKMVREEVIAQESKKTPFDSTKIKELQNTIGLQFNDPSALTASLATAGLTQNNLRKRLVRHIQNEKWLLRQSGAFSPTEAQCRAWFEANPAIAYLPEVVQASHFAAIFPPRGTPSEFLEKNDLIRDIQSRLGEGIPFSQLIDAFSDDPAKKITSGSLFWFSRERMEPSLVEAAFTLPIDKISSPIQTRFGFHLLIVHQHFSNTALTYEQVTDEVRLRYRDELTRKNIESIVTNLVQRAKVEILYPKPITTS